VLGRYVEALEAGDIDAAYGLLSSAQRRAISLEQLQSLAASYQDEVREQARQLERLRSEPVPVRAEMRGPGSQVATFTLEDGRWRIAEGAVGAASLESPLQAVRALRRALERRSYGAVMRVLSRDSRAVIEDEVARIAEQLADEEGLRVEITGNRARIVYDETHFIDLAREDGEWVVADMD
jgi:hypothetical protein